MNEFISYVHDGNFQPHVEKLIRHELKRHEGKRVILTIERLSKKRSSQQNRLFHMHVGILSREFGYKPDEMKNILKFKFLKTEKIDEKTGEVFEYIRDTSELTVVEFMSLIEDVVQFGAEFGVELPLPE